MNEIVRYVTCWDWLFSLSTLAGGPSRLLHWLTLKYSSSWVKENERTAEIGEIIITGYLFSCFGTLVCFYTCGNISGGAWCSAIDMSILDYCWERRQTQSWLQNRQAALKGRSDRSLFLWDRSRCQWAGSCHLFLCARGSGGCTDGLRHFHRAWRHFI